jgi:CheY-like chemotaxis protein/anti-sigma regulatory factor (Ser/Thr protein kinase)
VEVLARRDPADDVQRSARGMILRQVAHMVRLIDDLLDVSRVTRGKIALRREPVDVGAVCAQAVELARPLLDAGGHALAVSLPPAPVTVSADPARLVQIVSNLLTNAARFTPPGGHVALEVTRAAQAVELRVRDDGIGIAPELLDRIFEPFVQAETTPDRARGGLGIGLTLVRTLVALHGGQVEARSQGPGRGSEFTVRLPALAGAPVPEIAPVSVLVTPPQDVDRAASLRVLVVEDNPDVAESFVMLLDIEGHAVRAVSDGPAALALVAGWPPHVAFIDIGLPGMDGYELVRRLRATPTARAALLVAVSGYGRAEDKRRALAAGFDHHLTKPVDFAVIASLLRDIPAAARAAS